MSASSAGSGFSIEVELEVVEDALRLARRARAARSPSRVACPLLFCAVLAVLATGAAITESPLGQDPTVRPFADAARGGARAAWDDVVGGARRVGLVERR